MLDMNGADESRVNIGPTACSSFIIFSSVYSLGRCNLECGRGLQLASFYSLASALHDNVNLVVDERKRPLDEIVN
jgi:hypothetical protein